MSGANRQSPRRLGIALVCVTAIVMLLSMPLVGCGAVGQQSRILKVGMLLGSGGLGDRSFNDSAYAGLLEAQRRYNIRFETVTSVSKETNLNSLRSLASNNYDLIMAIGIEHLDTLQTVAKEYPKVHFAAVDFELAGDNVSSIVYREQEGDFLMGVLAAMLTKTKSVGVIGGTDIPAIRRIMSGFKQGVAYQDPSVKVTSDFAGTFSDPQVGLQLALSRYNEGVDVIHNAASRTGLGIIEAARQTGKLTTGTSGDQRYLAPGNVVGNRPKRVDTAVLMLVDEAQHGSLKSGVRSLGLKEDGLSLGPFDEKLVTREMSDRLDALKQKIVDGQIQIRVD